MNEALTEYETIACNIGYALARKWSTEGYWAPLADARRAVLEAAR